MLAANHFFYFWFVGNEIIDLITQENEIYSENIQRITVDTDWTDGLISRYVTIACSTLLYALKKPYDNKHKCVIFWDYDNASTRLISSELKWKHKSVVVSVPIWIALLRQNMQSFQRLFVETQPMLKSILRV